MQTDIDPRNLIGRKAFDRNGAKIGTVDEVYLDDATGVPGVGRHTHGPVLPGRLRPPGAQRTGRGHPAHPLRPRADQGRPRLRRRPPPLPGQELQLYHHYGLDVCVPSAAPAAGHGT